MARCHVCDAESTGLSEIPYKVSRKFHHDEQYPHLDICSDCRESFYDPPPNDVEEGEVELLEDSDD